MMTEFTTIRTETDAGIMTITLDRPERMNAFTTVMMAELIDAYAAASADDAVRAVIVTGAGRAFCAGADLAPDGAGTGDRGGPFASAAPVDSLFDPRVRDSGGRLTLAMFNCTKPIIGAVNGAAVGIGATMLLPMDIRLASDAARFGYVFARRGIVPEAASSWFLPRIVGMPQALEWCLTGRVFDAAEALRAGLVRAIHTTDELLGAARAIALEIADNTAPVSVALTRQMLWRLSAADHPMAAHRIDSRGVFTRARSADAAEGVASFLEKRAAVFVDRVSSDMPSFFPWWEEPDYQ